jgi:O-antigen/teichoic acid export membrane protein
MIKKLLSDSVVFGLSGILARVIGFILLPLYSKVLLPADYGLLGLYNSSFYLLFVLLVFGLDNATYRFFFDKGAPQNEEATVSTWFWTQMAISAAVLALVILLQQPIGRMLFGKTVDGGRIAISLIASLILYALPNIQEVWFRITKNPWGAFGFAIFTSLINIGTTFYFILYLKAGFWGFVYGQFVSYGIGTIVSLYLMRRRLSPRFFNAALLKRMMRYAAPLVPATGLYISINWICNYFLTRMLGYGPSGLYNMGNTFAMVLTLVINSFGQAYLPFAYSIMDREDAKRVYARVFVIYVSGMSLLTFGYGLFALDVLKLVTRPLYYGAHAVMIILAYQYFVASMATIGNLGANIRKQSSPFALSVLISTIACAILFWLLIPVWGIEGAALGMLVGQAITPVLTFIYSQRVYPIPFDFKTGLAIMLSSIGASILVQWMPGQERLWVSIATKSVLFVSYAGLLYLLLRFKRYIPGRTI